MFRRWLAVASGLVVALALSACGAAAPGDAQSGNTYHLLFVAGLTGATQSAAQSALDSVNAAAADINGKGGIDGRQIAVDSVDSQGDPTRAVTLLQDRISAGPKPDAVFAGLSSPETLAMLPVLTRNKILSFGNSASPAANNPASFPFHFGTAPTSTGQLVGLPALLEKRGVTKLSVLLPQDAFGDGNEAGLKATLPPSVKVTETRFDPKAIDLSVAWQRATSSAPQAVYADCFGDSCPRLFNARVTAGATDVPVIFGTGPSATGSGPAGFASPASLANLTASTWTFLLYKAPADRSKAFDVMYDAVAKGKQPTASLLPAFFAWDGLHSVALAADTAKSTDVTKVAAAMLDLKAPTGTWLTSDLITYTDQSHFPVPQPSLFSYVTPGPLTDGLFKIGS
jgi:branched-chain amino acid transport system substrate-binding protein